MIDPYDADPWLEDIGWLPSHEVPQPITGPGLLRRIRRYADLSQRDLAARLGVSQSTVARWETGRTSPSLAEVQTIADLVGLRLVLLTRDGTRLRPMTEQAARDRGGRRFPAHLDPRERGWAVRRQAAQEGTLSQEWRASRELGIPRVGFLHRGPWRDIARRAEGTPADHPMRAQLVGDVEDRTAETAGPPPTPPD